jgi:hypothetical protein
MSASKIASYLEKNLLVEALAEGMTTSDDDGDEEISSILSQLEQGVVLHNPFEHLRELIEEKEAHLRIDEQLTREKRAQDKSEGGDPFSLIAKATLPQKFKIALFGNASCRKILIGDRNKFISLAVLKNPRLTPAEVEEFCRSTTVPDFVLRAINDNSEWMKNYAIKRGLVFNGKTPLDVGMKWVKFLTEPDLRALARSKNVPNAIASLARRLSGG